jgi:hypothetical protein
MGVRAKARTYPNSEFFRSLLARSLQRDSSKREFVHMLQLRFRIQSQLGHMRPPAPADLMVFDQRETEEDAPVAMPNQVAKVLGDV